MLINSKSPFIYAELVSLKTLIWFIDCVLLRVLFCEFSLILWRNFVSIEFHISDFRRLSRKGIFIMPHPRWNGASGSTVPSEWPSYLFTFSRRARATRFLLEPEWPKASTLSVSLTQGLWASTLSVSLTQGLWASTLSVSLTQGLWASDQD